MKTIREIASEIGVSKQAIRKEIANLGLQTNLQKNGNQFVISEEQENLIKSAFKDRRTQTKNANQFTNQSQTENALDTVIDMLKKELEFKNQQITEITKSLQFEQGKNKELQDKVMLLERKKEEVESDPEAPATENEIKTEKTVPLSYFVLFVLIVLGIGFLAIGLLNGF